MASWFEEEYEKLSSMINEAASKLPSDHILRGSGMLRWGWDEKPFPRDVMQEVRDVKTAIFFLEQSDRQFLKDCGISWEKN